MSILDKIFRRRRSHDEWLAAHPGKGPMPNVPAGITPEDSQRMRDQMEAELQTDAEKRESRQQAPAE